MRLLILSFLVFPIIASAMSPATDDQLLCGNYQVIFAHILDAKSADCRLTITQKDPDLLGCADMNSAILSLKVIKVIGSYNDNFYFRNTTPENLKPGDIIDRKVEVFHISLIGGKETGHFDVQGRLSRLKPENEVFTDAEAREIFKGQDFYLSGGLVWRASKKEWVYQTLSRHEGHNCPRLQSNQ